MLRAVCELRLWEPGARVLVGVSGGPDSIALLACLLELPTPWRPLLTAAHFDHGLRPSSAAEAEQAAALARGLGVSCLLGSAPLRPLPGRSPEQEARVARYAFLAAAAGQAGTATVAVGHQRDDRAETILLRLLRGSGSRGLGGIRPSRALAPACRLVRPLWYAGRSEVLAFLERRGLPFVVDPSNADLRRPRNRLRHEVLPALDRALGPGARGALLRAADNLAADDAALAVWTAREAALRLRGAALTLGAGWDDLPAAIRHRLVQWWWESLTGLPPLGARTAAAVCGQGACDLPAGWRTVTWKGVLVLLPPAAAAALALPVPGAVEVAGVGRIRARLGTAAAGGRLLACGPPRCAAGGLLVRAPLPGERLEAGGRRRPVRDLLREAGIPPAARSLPRVVATRGGSPLWVAGVRPAAGFAVPAGSPALVLALEPEGGPPALASLS